MKDKEIAALRAEVAEQAGMTRIIAAVAVGALRELERLASETGRPSPIERLLESLDDNDPLLGVTSPELLAQKEELREGVIQLLQTVKTPVATR